MDFDWWSILYILGIIAIIICVYRLIFPKGRFERMQKAQAEGLTFEEFWAQENSVHLKIEMGDCKK